MKSKAGKFWELMETHRLDHRVLQLITKEDHSMGMVVDWLKRDYPTIIASLLPIGPTLRSRILAQKALSVSSNYNHKSPQWKLQYRYNQETISAQCRKGATLTLALRKGKKEYNAPQHLAYWKALGHSPVAAEQKATQFKRENSPRCPEFWVKKGLSPDQARTLIRNQAINGALASLKKTQQPKTEHQVAEFLIEHRIPFGRQLKLTNTESTDPRLVFVYDFHIPTKNLLVEVNGTFWHADRRVFEPDDVIHFPGKRTFLARNIWQRDEVKREAALKAGYELTTIWELDLRGEAWKQNLLKLLK